MEDMRNNYCCCLHYMLSMNDGKAHNFKLNYRNNLDYINILYFRLLILSDWSMGDMSRS